MRSCEGTGKNIEQAIQNALLELKASREDVDIKILSEGGFLKKAKVLVTISADALDKYEKREKLRAVEEKENADEDFAETFIKKKVDVVVTSQNSGHGVTIVADEEYVLPVEKEESVNQQHALESENETREKSKTERQEKKLTGEEFISGVLESLGLEGTVEKTEDDRFVHYHLNGQDLNDLIGHHGECMLSLSYLMSLVCKTEDKKRMTLDIENYREKRQESLTALAKRIADKVAKSGRYYRLEPMDASERKVIHLALQNDDRVTTLSKGEEPNRYLIVFPKEYKD